MNRAVLLAIFTGLLLSACVSREYSKETVVQPTHPLAPTVTRPAVVVPGPQGPEGPPGPPGPPGDTTIIVPNR